MAKMVYPFSCFIRVKFLLDLNNREMRSHALFPRKWTQIILFVVLMTKFSVIQILLYCRSSVPPQHQWPATQKLFTLDVMYLHDKPGPENCPQKVYDALVDALEQVSEYEGYIFESGQGLTRILFRHMCVLLSHPQQRCVQDDIDIPKSLTKKSATTDAAPAEEIVPVSSQWKRKIQLNMQLLVLLRFGIYVYHHAFRISGRKTWAL